jgi:predicted MFS family arabinose efflux permease
LAGVQSVGNTAASAVAGLLLTLVSSAAAFLWLALWMMIALVVFVANRSRRN